MELYGVSSRGQKLTSEKKNSHPAMFPTSSQSRRCRLSRRHDVQWRVISYVKLTWDVDVFFFRKSHGENFRGKILRKSSHDIYVSWGVVASAVKIHIQLFGFWIPIGFSRNFPWLFHRSMGDLKMRKKKATYLFGFPPEKGGKKTKKGAEKQLFNSKLLKLEPTQQKRPDSIPAVKGNQWLISP